MMKDMAKWEKIGSQPRKAPRVGRGLWLLKSDPAPGLGRLFHRHAIRPIKATFRNLCGSEAEFARTAMKHFALLALLAAALLVTGRPAVSQDLNPGIIGEDDRVRLDLQGPPWDAIGQVNISTYRMAGQCTGTLVAPNVVITAAHCIMDPFRKAPFPLHDIHFLAAVRGSDNKGHETADCLHFPKDYVYVGPEKSRPRCRHGGCRRSSSNRRSGDRPERCAHGRSGAFGQVGMPKPGLRLVHVAYPADHRFLPWAHFDCHLLRSDLQKPLWFNDCDTHVGSSGGPVFVEQDGTYKLAAIMLGGVERMYTLRCPFPNGWIWRATPRAPSVTSFALRDGWGLNRPGARPYARRDHSSMRLSRRSSASRCRARRTPLQPRVASPRLRGHRPCESGVSRRHRPLEFPRSGRPAGAR